MKKKYFQHPFGIFFMCAAIISATARGNNLPDTIHIGWRYYSLGPPDYVIGTDTSVKHGGKASGFIQHPFAQEPSTSIVTLMQLIAAEGFRHKRVKLTVYTRSIDLESGAFFFFQVDGADTILAYANTAATMLEETNDWTLYHITLDVPEAAINIEFGVKMMPGQGTLWVDDFNLEVVDQAIPSDDWVGPRKMRVAVTKLKYQPYSKAMNLGFEDR